MTPLTATLLSLWIVAGASVLSVFLYRRWKKRRRLIQLVNKFPGPKYTLPVLGDLFQIFGDPNTLLERSLKYIWEPFKPRLRFWLCHQPVIGLSDPSDLEIILGDPKHNTKPSAIYRLVECFFGRGLLTLNGLEWRFHRKAITPSFHFSVLEQYADIFLERAQILSDRMVQLCGQSEMDLLPLVATTTNETICETAFGCRVSGESKEHRDREAFIQDMESAFRIMQYRALHPWFMSDMLFALTEMARQHRIAEQKIHNYAASAIRTRKQALASTEKKDDSGEDDSGIRQRYSFLDLMLTKDDGLSEEDILGEVRTLIAVQETSSTTVCFALLMLAMHQDIQHQVFEEIQDVWSEPDLTSLQRLQSLHVMDRVLKETLRLFPPVPIIGREAMRDIELSDGKVIPRSSYVVIVVYGVHRDSNYFPEPEKFNPDRFLPENCVGRHPYAYIPFSAGPRNCVGQKYGMLQMKAIMTNLVRRYKISLPEGVPTKVCDLKLTVDTFLKLVGGWRVRLTLRSSPVAGA